MADLITVVVAFVAGLILGFDVPSAWMVPMGIIALIVCVDTVFEKHIGSKLAMRIGILIGTLFVFTVGAVIGGIANSITQHPVVLLYAFWLYALVATGYLISRCCVGWHVGASGAVLLSFLAVGMLIQSFFNGNAVWLVLFIVAAGMWWGADSWRRANGLPING
jgi:hypothetical protein